MSRRRATCASNQGGRTSLLHQPRLVTHKMSHGHQDGGPISEAGAVGSRLRDNLLLRNMSRFGLGVAYMNESCRRNEWIMSSCHRHEADLKQTCHTDMSHSHIVALPCRNMYRF